MHDDEHVHESKVAYSVVIIIATPACTQQSSHCMGSMHIIQREFLDQVMFSLGSVHIIQREFLDQVMYVNLSGEVTIYLP